MTLWFCNVHRQAGTSADAPCCASAVLAVAAGDRAAWLRIRLGMRTDKERDELLMLRLDREAQRQALVRHARRTGKRWVRGRAA